MTGINFGADELRIILHVLAVSVWLGGQVLMMGLVPVLRKLDEGAPKLAAAAFGRVAWPAFGVAVATGIWNLMAVDLANVTSGYNAVFGIKILLVLVSGGAAALHQSSDSKAVRGATGAVGFFAALIAFVLGIMMSH